MKDETRWSRPTPKPWLLNMRKHPRENQPPISLPHVRGWILTHPGVAKRIARTCKVSQAFVSMVAYGKCRSAKVERELSAAGWRRGPGGMGLGPKRD